MYLLTIDNHGNIHLFITTVFSSCNSKNNNLKKIEIMEIYGIKNSIAFCEAKGLSVVFNEYAENCNHEEIMEIGFNANSGYVYIALENGVQICSMLGRSVEYITTDFETGEESFFDTYEEAIKRLTDED